MEQRKAEYVGAEREVEDDVIDEWTVDGYLQTEAIWDAREEVEFVLGKGAWKKLFHVTRDGRLEPTTWLNKVAQYSMCFESLTSNFERSFPRQ